MQRLATELRAQNRTLKQIKRDGMVALYELYGPQGLLYGFEVIIIKIHKAEEICGRIYPEHEGYPSSAKNSNDWGNIAWSYGCKDRVSAETAYTHLCEMQGRGVLTQTDLVASEGHDSGLTLSSR